VISADIIFTIVLLPLTASIIAGLFRQSIGDKGAMGVTTTGVIMSALLSLYTFYHMAFKENAQPGFTEYLYTWISTGDFSVNFGVMVDKLTATMLLVVTSVSACVHVYSIGYMAHDPHRARFFSYLSLFTFTMLALVTAPNLLQMFLGWEGVGLASYLLIGFWFKKPSANAAAMKAFIVNRVADLGLLLAIFTVFLTMGSLEYTDIFAQVNALHTEYFSFLGFDIHLLSLIAILLFIGAMGKSAQLGFHTWLPDAMEGPTPVSALIHAATMVTAGVFLVARMSPLFEFAPSILEIVTWVGGLTAIFAATIGMTQHDIKRVIAYSTCSQLGYMFFACGIGAYPAAIFHLTTHAFFKALLFLGAGSVIHGVSDEQDMRKMGGLKFALPVTYFIMLIGSLALMGIPPFAGFFSKDLILESAFMSHTTSGLWMYGLGTAAAFMTAFYSARVFYLTFYGKNRGDEEVYKHAHESGLVMLAPMFVLVLGAIFSGWALHEMGTLDWWQGAIFIADYHTGLEHAHHIAWQWKYLPLAIVGLGGLFGTIFYLWKTDLPVKVSSSLGLIYTFVYRKWMVDELYNGIFVCGVKYLAHKFHKVGDVLIIDGILVNGVAKITNLSGIVMRRFQTGYIFHYAFAVVLGMCALLTWLVF